MVEGLTDEAMAHRLAKASGHDLSVCYGKKGVGYIQKRIAGFNGLAKNMPILTLVDFMDTRMACPPDMVHAWLPHREQGMLLRAVVRELESWLLADRNGIAEYLKIPMSRVPENPESLSDPKATLIHLARKSRSSRIREGLVPAQGSSAIVGREYTSGIIHFIRESWNMNQARMNASSLDHCILCLENLWHGTKNH